MDKYGQFMHTHRHAADLGVVVEEALVGYARNGACAWPDLEPLFRLHSLSNAAIMVCTCSNPKPLTP